MRKIQIYCEDLEKMIYEDGCYDADGSTICQTCQNKPDKKKKTGRDFKNKQYKVKSNR